MHIRLITLSLALLVALAIPTSATASGDEAIRDCAQDGDLDKEYSDEELQDAEENMPSDIDAYSSCRDVFRQAQSGGRGGTNGTTGGGAIGGTTGGGDGGSNDGDASGGEGANSSDLDEINRRQQEAQDDNAPATDAALNAGADAGGDDSGLPAAALVAIVLLGLAAVGGGLYLLRDYLPPGLTSRLPGASR